MAPANKAKVITFGQVYLRSAMLAAVTSMKHQWSATTSIEMLGRHSRKLAVVDDLPAAWGRQKLLERNFASPHRSSDLAH